MKEITSRENPDFRRLLKVLDGKRVPEGDGPARRMAVLEGIHLCESWLASGFQPEQVFVSDDRLSNVEVAAIVARVQPASVRVCGRRLFAEVSQVVNAQGILFLCAPLRSVLPASIAENCIWLDRVQDPGNMGTLIRTAAAAGIRHVYASAGCVSAWSSKVLRSAQGAHFVTTIHEGCDLQALCERLEIPLLATSLGEAESLYETDIPAQAAWVFGNEGGGVADELVRRADLRVFIPQDRAVESLNVAVAAAVCLFEQRRRYLKPDQ